MATMTEEERKALQEQKRAEREGKLTAAGDNAPAQAGSILRKARSGSPSVLIIGGAGTGKSTQALKSINAKGLTPLWLPLNNDAVLHTDEAGDWDAAVPANWKEFLTHVYQPAMRGDFKDKYTSLVIDGGDVLAGYALNHQTGAGNTAELRDWQLATNALRDAIVQLRGKFGSVYFIVDVVTGKDMVRKINLNPYMKNTLVPLFADKLYTHVIRERDGAQKLTGNLIYTVQTNPMLALELQPGNKVTLDTAQ